MMEHTIITIGRQFGSGGHEVGNRLAERLDIPLYDHNLLHMAAQGAAHQQRRRYKGRRDSAGKIPVRICGQQYRIPGVL